MQYGIDKKPIQPPINWRILPQGDPIPPIHREYYSDHVAGRGCWAAYRLCHSTMTPFVAQVWGKILAFAVPDPPLNIAEPPEGVAVVYGQATLRCQHLHNRTDPAAAAIRARACLWIEFYNRRKG